MKTVTIHVEQRHIDAGEPYAALCPIALALHETGYPEAIVGSDCWYPHRKAGAPLSRSAVRFIERFDDGLPVKPATFRLPLPETPDA